MGVEEFIYADTAIGGVKHRNNPRIFLDIYKDSLTTEMEPDSYLGAFLFAEDFKNHVNAKGSVRGFKGIHWAYFLAIDIDRDDLGEAKWATSTLIEIFQEEHSVDPDLLHIFFSGNKGFHILIPTRMFNPAPSKSLSKTFRMMTCRMCGSKDADLSIYEPLRLLRLPNTKHLSSNLYKIPLTFKELFLPTYEILGLAKKPRLDFRFPPKAEGNTALRELYEDTLGEVDVLEEKKTIIIPEKLPTPIEDTKMCYLKLLEGVGKGIRNEATIRLASHFRKIGYPMDTTIAILKDWDKRNDPSFASEDVGHELTRTIESAYENEDIDYGCFDHILSEACQDNCFLKNKKDSAKASDDINTLEDAAKAYIEWHREGKGIRLGIDPLDDTTRGLMPGHVMAYLAYQGGGKTAFAIHMMKNISQQGKYSLFLSLEMPMEEVFEREVQMVRRISGLRVENFVKDKMLEGYSDEEILEQILASSRLKVFDKVLICDESTVTVNQAEAIIEKAKTKWPLSAVFIDYLGRMHGYGKDNQERVAGIAKELKSMAKRTKLPIIYLSQTSRNLKTISDMPSQSDARGSGEIEESADFIIASSRPHLEDTRPRNTFQIRVLKCRRGPPGKLITLYFDAENMQFLEYESIQRTDIPY